jgi:hypothetical protein
MLPREAEGTRGKYALMVKLTRASFASALHSSVAHPLFDCISVKTIVFADRVLVSFLPSLKASGVI